MGTEQLDRPIGKRRAVMGSAAADRRAGSTYFNGAGLAHRCARCGIEHVTHYSRPTSVCGDCRAAISAEREEVARLIATGDPRTPSRIKKDAAIERAKRTMAAGRARPQSGRPRVIIAAPADWSLEDAYRRQRGLIDAIVADRLS